ncbi:MAG: cytochrome P450 [Alphaproteobacteria bacterium]
MEDGLGQGETGLDAAAMAQSFDLMNLPVGFVDDPYPIYHALRVHDPVRTMPDGSLFLTRHADLERIYKDTVTYSSDKREEFAPKFGSGPLFQHHTTSLVFNDPPLHTHVRRIMAGALTPRAIADMEASVVELVDRLLDEMADKAATGGTVDLIEDFAAAIPIEVIGNMLGVPRDERGPLRDWSLSILGALEPALTDAQLRAGEEAVEAFLDYLKGLVTARRQHPGDPEKDVLTRLIQGEVDGERLLEMQLLQNVIFILNAGHETTTNLIGNGLVTLLDWPDETQRLLDDPGLIRTAVEEFLRFESSNQLGNRATTVATEIGGREVPAGTRVTLCIGAANRDPERFAKPDVLDVGRQPNRHLAFASGAHQCIGMNVARLEGRIAIGRFLARFPDYRAAGEFVRGGRVRFRGFLSLPVQLG